MSSSNIYSYMYKNGSWVIKSLTLNIKLSGWNYLGFVFDSTAGSNPSYSQSVCKTIYLLGNHLQI